ncbi:MAG: MATE family efflux transporter [Eubacteriales bacterium]|jgi:putative MATE family efflux protein
MKDNVMKQNFTLPRLLWFVLPTVVMMVAMSTYTSVDGAFVSKMISEDALAAVNIVYPVISVIVALSLMLATGSNAIIARKLGEGKGEEARQFFTLIYGVGFGSGVVLSLLCWLGIEPLLAWLGTTPELYGYAREYLGVLLWFFPMGFLQMFTQNFFVTEGKPGIGLTTCLLGGVANIVLDYVFMGPCQMGIAGAAVATGIGYSVPGLYGVWYFARNAGGTLHFQRPRWRGREMLHTCSNGSSELVNNLSVAITTLLFNLTMLHYVGEAGVSAITVILYLQFIQAAVYFGYAQGIAPVISYKYGQGDQLQLHGIVRTSIFLLTGCSLLVVLFSILLADEAVMLFLEPGSSTFALARRGFLIFSTSYLFMGVNVFLSAMFTALSNGFLSALLSFLRTLVFLVGGLLFFPWWLGVDGVWIAVPAAEALSAVVGYICYRSQKKRYGY